MWLKLLLLLYTTWFFAECHADKLKLEPISASEAKRLLRIAKREDLISKDRIITKGIIGRSLNANNSSSSDYSTDDEIRKLCFFSKISRSARELRKIPKELGRSASESIACEPNKLKKISSILKLPASAYFTTRTNFATGSGRSSDATGSSSESDYVSGSTSDDQTGTGNDHEIGTSTENQNAYDNINDATSATANNDETEDDISYITKPNSNEHSGHMTQAPTTTTAADSVLCDQFSTTAWSLTPDTGTTTTIVGYANELPFNMPTTAPSLLGLNEVDNKVIASTGTAAEPTVVDTENGIVAEDVQQEVAKAKREIIHCISFEENTKRKRSLSKYRK